MGILDNFTATVREKLGVTGDQQQGMLNGLCELLNHPETGGLPGIVDKLKAAGLGHLADGWVSNGPNPPISADQLKNVFSREQLQGFAQKLGIDVDAATKHVAEMLPHVVDQLTPNGQLPTGNVDPAAILAQLKQKVFGS